LAPRMFGISILIGKPKGSGEFIGLGAKQRVGEKRKASISLDGGSLTPQHSGVPSPPGQVSAEGKGGDVDRVVKRRLITIAKLQQLAVSKGNPRKKAHTPRKLVLKDATLANSEHNRRTLLDSDQLISFIPNPIASRVQAILRSLSSNATCGNPGGLSPFVTRN